MMLQDEQHLSCFWPTIKGLIVERITALLLSLLFFSFHSHSQTTPSFPVSANPGFSQNGTVTLDWTGPWDSQYLGYTFIDQYYVDGEFVEIPQIDHPNPINGTTFTITGLKSGEHRFRVLGNVNNPWLGTIPGAYGEVTVIVAIKPGTPPSVIPSTSLSKNGSVTVSWGASSGSVSAYQLQQQANGGSWNTIYNGSGRSKSISGLNNGSYKYRVIACKGVSGYISCSGWRTSSVVTVLKVPTTPSGISAPATDDDGIFSLSWGAASGSVTSYQLQQKHGSGSWSNIQNNSSRTKSVNVTNDGTYYYRVRACNSSGCSAFTANASVNVAIPLAPPSAPAWKSTSATDSDFGDYDLEWSQANGVVNTYQLQERVDNGSWNPVQLSASNALFYDARGKVAGDYNYRVRACNVDACSGWRSRNVEVHNLQGVAPAVTITAADAPGSTKYRANVSPQGSAQLSLPLNVVPGVNGAEPVLSLSYSSGRPRQRINDSLPEDVLGYGWQVGGFSEIRHCVKGKPGTSQIQLSTADNLCLDGEPMALVSGTHLQPGAVYRLIRDDFTKVVMQGTASQGWFKIFKPNGEVRELGNTSASRVRVKDSSGTSPYFLWTINKSTDAFGNAITYTYHKDEVSGINYPLSIQYGQNNDASINFHYARRDDAVPVQLANIEAEQLVLLHTIDIKLDGAKVRQYRLASELATEGWRRLDQVQECGYDETGSVAECLQPLNFNWLSDPDTEYKTAITQVIDGLGAVTEFDYVMMTSASSAGKFSERPFGNEVLPTEAEVLEADADGNLKSVVTALRKSNGLGGLHQTNFAYHGNGLVNTKNWGFLGFYAQRIEDTASGIVTYNQFRLDEPHFVQVAATHQYDNVYGSHTETLSKILNQYSEKSFTHSSGKTTGYPFRSASLLYQYDNNVLVGVKKIAVSNQYASGLLTQRTETTSFAHGATASGGGAFWGDTPSYTLSGVQRTVQSVQTFQNRTSSQWLVGFMNSLEERYYSGGVSSGNLDRTKTVNFTPHASSNKVATTVQFPGDPNLQLTETRTYNGNGLLTSATQVGQNVASRTVVSNSSFAKGRYPTLQYNAANHGYSQSYDYRFGVADQVTDPNSRTSSVVLDGFGREISRTDADGVTQTTLYESCDLVICTTVGAISPAYRVRVNSSIAPESIQYFDVLGRVIRSAVKGFDGTSYVYQDVHYDAQGRVDRYSQPYFAGDTAYFTQNGYDIRNRLEAQILPNNGSKTIDYTPNGSTHQVSVTIAEDVYKSDGSIKEIQTTTSQYNMLGELVVQTEAVGTSEAHSVSYDYHGDGLLKQSVAGGNTTTIQYDEAGNRTSLVDPSFGTITNQYTALGQLHQTTDNKGQVTTYAYDLLGRQTQEATADGTASWVYDPSNAIGALAAKSYGSGHSETYSYNGNAKLTGIQTNISVSGFTRTYTQSFSYDSYGRVETATLPTGLTVEQIYNAQGYVSAIQDSANDEALVTYQAMDAYGNISTQNFGNGITQTLNHDQRTGGPNSIQSFIGSTVLQNNTYGWQSNGILEYRATNDGGTFKEELFAYDAHNRLTTSTTTVDSVVERTLTTSYAPNGNITSKLSSVATDPETTGYTYGGTTNASAYAVSNVTIKGIQNTLHYDANGSITEYDAAIGDDRFITWSSRNKPTQITLGASANDAAPTARDELAYDADGNRYYKKSTWKDDQDIQQVEHTFYVGQFEEIVSSNDSDYQGVKKSRIGDSILHVVATLDNTTIENSFEYLLRDHLGSVEKVTDETGSVLMTQAFDPFGERRSDTWLTSITDVETDALLETMEVATSRGYTGHEHLSRTGIIHMNGRIYDAQLGKFLSPDPIVVPEKTQSWNRYSYVMNSPNSYTDPTGYHLYEVIVIGQPSPSIGMGLNLSFSTNIGSIGSLGMIGGPSIGSINIDLGDIEFDSEAVRKDQTKNNKQQNEKYDDEIVVYGSVAKGPGYVFSSVDAAASDAILYASQNPLYTPNNKLREQGGDIYPIKGGYTYNDLQEGDESSVNVKVRQDSVAWFHIHPPGESRSIDLANRFWSPGDRRQNRKLSKILKRDTVAYIGGTDGAVRAFKNGGPRQGTLIQPPGFFSWK